MNLDRRQFLAAAAAWPLVPAAGRAAGATPLLAHPARQQIAPDGHAQTPIWSYDGSAPGAEIRVAQGARVVRQLRNDLPQATSVHWHGIRIDNAMDGVPGLTQEAVPPGGQFDYDFTVPDAGTYWYHAHNRSMEQVARGLYGPLIVEEADAPEVDRDLVLMVDDWRLDPDTVELTGDFDNGHDLGHAGRLGNIVTVNGRFDPEFRVRRHERLRLRLTNAANARVFELGLDGLEGWIVALDGMPLDTPLAVTGAFPLAPAQRADLIVDVTAEAGATASLLSIERDGGYGLTRFQVGGVAAQSRRPAPQPLPPNPVPDLDEPARAPLSRMRLQGGAMRWLDSARLGDTELSGRELAELGRFWALNGYADRPAEPFLDAARGSLHRIAFVNETAFDHGMHLHGHHFRLLTEDGRPGPWRDTVLVRRGETRQIAMVADNPGNWLLHCHMLGHAASGMMSWFRVA
ncbi:Multicopper oxidase with three cupredoxin domains (includes cell division protein FtsP and spore coat protein CotA) [Cribrihabitans marinus]|uniref:Multicopper oxidase with three cupredoxin domains (Includes cell division protein FtsP and spore coat protein CotA) n=1 Tax=Cribrihabitans marinus TaxID=1227549 RepID=A0A1H6TPY5_9RHOB|nr:multicopper oxidase domain-containing protein [Cribrihabitans marinus]GGH21977.1 oxidoreductase [Cribrihabitans marinus]SEI77792.1 Multicopper oxidase with three cupredoxin domains (includes cell division protein FtsP and spore coat protein CotA) [Cribrihabitans marinus]